MILKCPKRQSGFSLVETAIVVVVFGLLITAAISLFKPMTEEGKDVETQERLQKVADAISSYALRYNRIPCPANPDESDVSPPFGAERGSGAAGTDPGTCTASEASGIVPFRTLGIPQDSVRDAWGHFITYHVSPAFSTSTPVDNIHRNCRTSQWVDGGTNENPDKARFCCAGISTYAPSTDITVRDETGAILVPARESASGQYANFDNETTANGNESAVIYILVSHGKNAYGYYLGTGTNARESASQSGGNERENADDDNVFVDSPRVAVTEDDYFDDIVLWRTQSGVMRELGVDSCSRP